MRALDADDILWDVIQEHLDEAEYLWGAWERGLSAAHLNLDDLATSIESRLFAHIHGLVVACPAAIERVLIPALDDLQRERAAAASLAWLRSGDAQATRRLCGLLTEVERHARAGIARGLGLGPPAVLGLVEPLSDHRDPAVRGAALQVIHDQGRRIDSTRAAVLEDSKDAAVNAASIAHGAPTVITAVLARGPDDPNFAAALREGMILRIPAAWTAVTDWPGDRTAAAMLGIFGGERGLRLLLTGVDDPARRGASLWGLGFTGRLIAGDACARWLADSVHGGIAGDSLLTISGIDYVDEGMSVPHTLPDPKDDEAPEMGIDALVSWPEAGALGHRWGEARRDFVAESRYLRGQLATVEALRGALLASPMWRGIEFGVEVAARSGGRVRIPTRSFTKQQSSTIATSTRIV